jgi:hypothetical protein
MRLTSAVSTTLLSMIFAGAIAGASFLPRTVLAADAAAAPAAVSTPDTARFLDVTQWSATIDARFDVIVQGSAGLPVAASRHVRGTATLARKDPAGALYEGSFAGTASTASNAGIALDSAAKVSLELSLAENAYLVRLEGAGVDATDFSKKGNALPASGRVLDGSDGGRFWTIKPLDAVLSAAPSVAPFTRGAKAHLDATASIGHPARYKWTVDPKRCPGRRGETAAAASHEAATWDTVVLCDAGVKLEVWNDEGKHEEKTLAVSPAARVWKTTFEQKDPQPFDAAFIAGAYEFGRNVCAEGGAANDKVHHTDARSWQDSGYTASQVADPGGPFDGWTYVESATVKVERIPQFNSTLAPGGFIDLLNSDCGAQKDPKLDTRCRKEVMARLLHQVKAHEAAHGLLMKKELENWTGAKDPAQQIEPMCSAKKAPVINEADNAIRALDIALTAASSEARVKQELAKDPEFAEDGKIWVLDQTKRPMLYLMPPFHSIVDE